jgi:hypothetical protein
MHDGGVSRPGSVRGDETFNRGSRENPDLEIIREEAKKYFQTS